MCAINAYLPLTCQLSYKYSEIYEHNSLPIPSFFKSTTYIHFTQWLCFPCILAGFTTCIFILYRYLLSHKVDTGHLPIIQEILVFGKLAILLKLMLPKHFQHTTPLSLKRVPDLLSLSHSENVQRTGNNQRFLLNMDTL